MSIVTGKADTRMFSLLDQLGLSDHLVKKEDMDVDRLLATDFSGVSAKKKALRKTSFDYLESALQGL